MMGLYRGSPPLCPRQCSQWARIYMKYCLCNVRDGVSLSLGLLSVVSWGIAEVPQIITNYKQKSTEGLSLAFLITWIIGDLFNVFGCMLEPYTLPTQFYMAVLYTITTVILASQTIYYGHIHKYLKANGRFNKNLKHPQTETVYKEKQTNNVVGEDQVSLLHNCNNGSIYSEREHLPSSPIPVAAPVLPRNGSHGREFYYTSARSLSKSRTATAGSYLACSYGYGRTPHTSFQDLHSVEQPLLAGHVSAHSAPPMKTRGMLSVVPVLMFFFSGFALNIFANKRFVMTSEKSPQGIVIQVGRKILQDSGESLLRNGDERKSGIGTILGWVMAAIYMGGRLPQIFLNIRRGKAEGLNPLMFIFALLGNGTYIASILVKSLEWSKIRSNLPWLVDAGGCILLDCFIITQFIYFRYRKPKDANNGHDNIGAA